MIHFLFACACVEGDLRLSVDPPYTWRPILFYDIILTQR